MSRTISTASQKRIAAFVDDFIRSDYVEETRYNFPRADGSTHGEQIHDWREQFQGYVQGRYLPRLRAAVGVYWDDLEAWHEKHGSLDTPIG